MSKPVAVYGLTVPAGDMPIPASPDSFPASFRVTMAALDPTSPPQEFADLPANAPPRATLKLIREPVGAAGSDTDSDYEEGSDSDDSDSGSDVEAIKARLASSLAGESSEEDSDEEGESDEELEKNGGPSDPVKAKKKREEAAARKLKEALEEEGMDLDGDDVKVNGVNGEAKKVNKGKGKAMDLADLEDEDEDSESGFEMEEYVICTLDPNTHYQQNLDITINEDEQVYFKVIGTHNIFLTGNYIIPEDRRDETDSEDDDYYDLPPDSDEELLEDAASGADESEDALDYMQDPRVAEVVSDDEPEAPKLVKSTKEDKNKKGNKKRPAEPSEDEDEAMGGADTLDELISKTVKAEEPEQKLSKKQLKKLKNNQGQAVAAAAAEVKEVKKSDGKVDKKVQFAKELEQGPTPSPNSSKKEEKKDGKKGAQEMGAQKEEPKKENAKTNLGVKTVQGVKIDDKKLGKGPAAKKGDRVGLRYIGKLEDGKVFDANKKGKPFTFKLGAGEVIRGWDIGVGGMSVGGERRITIPSSLAYGTKGVPGIPPNSTLVFDLKVISVN
ncbi:hypothetical protein BDY21DRAFT_344545 [Lineolata rhizophorae]|uniref:peptidylprolyl isomerase n=1 Tax=Lineolata rhizophorae TaxID=578093 RepID=A0A6A6P1I5_9PEZI|nr:hypothetical protein BDY21DRAFT_344545 [Lineolata rhizophorae]